MTASAVTNDPTDPEMMRALMALPDACCCCCCCDGLVAATVADEGAGRLVPTVFRFSEAWDILESISLLVAFGWILSVRDNNCSSLLLINTIRLMRRSFLPSFIDGVMIQQSNEIVMIAVVDCRLQDSKR